jgi:uncharacterized protein
MKILLSPAKNIDSSKRFSTTAYSVPIFLSNTEKLVKKMQKFSVPKLAKLMDLSQDLAQLNVERFQNWKPYLNLEEGGEHAAAIFNGEVYRGLDAHSFDAETMQRAQADLRILSGLYGILKPLDIIHPYRLEMGTRFPITPKTGSLYQFWGDSIADALNEEEQELIVNLASTEYFKAVPLKKLKARVITPVFKEFKNGKYQIVMVYAKQARGMMANYILQTGASDVESIKAFNREGYLLDANLSSEDELVFTR